jgi:TRAP-type C4-dicarboxylate transport system permease small subunit
VLRTLLFRLPQWIMGSLMLGGIAIIFVNVVSRYFFGRAIFWAEEVLVFMSMWGVFLGLVAVTFNGDHLNMDLFSSRFSGRWKTALNALVVFTLVASCLFVAIQSWKIVSLFAQTGQVSVAAAIPKAIPHAALLVGFALAAFAAVVRFRAYLAGKF